MLKSLSLCFEGFSGTDLAQANLIWITVSMVFVIVGGENVEKELRGGPLLYFIL